jgi:branched-chain amino acid aminotransferase
MMWIYLNDRFLPKEQACVSVLDHGFLYGDGVYETLRAYGGRVLQLAEHLTRLERSASSILLQLPIGRDPLADLIRSSLHRNRLQDAYIRVTVSRGEGDIGLDPSLCKAPTLVIIAKPLVSYPASLYAEGVSLAVVKTRRNLPEAIPSHVKSLNFLNNILAKAEASAAGAHEGLMLNHRGELAEGTSSNVFLVSRERLLTPSIDCGILDGITRRLVLRVARDLGMVAEEARLRTEDLYEADECFLTNTTQEILPVRQVDGRLVGKGQPGEITNRLRASFRDRLDGFLDAP